ncbi:MAG: hypothetical protein H6Q99_3611 [Proteobacteria bacterium]|nr:hypothetical protein [Pseudomonadota bacterium]
MSNGGDGELPIVLRGAMGWDESGGADAAARTRDIRVDAQLA